MNAALKVGILEYGVGNLSSVRSIFQKLGCRCRVARGIESLAECDVLVLPGVGAFPAAMSALERTGLAEFICSQATAGKPILGICLGMQLLAESSAECGNTDGLGLISGRVALIPDGRANIGWNDILVPEVDSFIQPHNGKSAFFNHSYHVEATSSIEIAVSSLDEGSPLVTAAIRKDNIFGFQFHPEKSQSVGEDILRTFLEEVRHA